MQSKQDLEDWWSKTDPWEYADSQDDKKRALFIKAILSWCKPKAKRLLDVGAGDGFITKQIPAFAIDAIEISDNAAERFPRAWRVAEPKGKYDVVIATGVLYEQYDYEQMRKWIIDSAEEYVLTCHYDKAGVAHDEFDKPQIFYAEFPYREGKQILRLYKWK